MAYTPELTYENSCTLRRISWAWGMAMTEAIDEIIQETAKRLDRNDICSCCRDRSKCNECRFDIHKQKNVGLRKVS